MSITHVLKGGHTSDDVTVTVTFNVYTSMLSYIVLNNDMSSSLVFGHLDGGKEIFDSLFLFRRLFAAILIR